MSAPAWFRIEFDDKRIAVVVDEDVDAGLGDPQAACSEFIVDSRADGECEALDPAQNLRCSPGEQRVKDLRKPGN